MARSAGGTNDLAKLLAAATMPIYLLDETRHLRYANQAFYDWIGDPGEKLLGSRCDYHSQPKSTEMLGSVAGLCPPPEVFRGERKRAIVGWTRSGKQLVRRWAEFLPLGEDPSDCPAVLAVLEITDISETHSVEPAGRVEAPQELHELVRHFYQEIQQQFALQQLIGSSSVIRKVRQQIELAASTLANVMIIGPPGSGREHVARTIAYGKTTGEPGPLLPIDCSVVDHEILEATLEAFRRRIGDFPKELPVTLLLLDLQDLPLDAQSVLEQRVCRENFPVRVLATARPPSLEGRREEGFHHGLRQWLTTLVIELVPLHQRLEDLPALAQLYLEELNAQGESQRSGFSDEVLDRLASYSWPNNVDELFAVVKQAHGASEDPLIQLHDLPPQLHWAAQVAARPPREKTTIDLDQFLAEIEEELIHRAVADSQGNKAQAARSLGISRARLHRRLQQLGVRDSRSPED